MSIKEDLEKWCNASYKAGAEAMRKKAVEACKDEHLIDSTGEEGDNIYDKAIDHCVNSIEAIDIEGGE